MTEDLYKILEIKKTATPAEIKKAYRVKAKVHHPDKGGDPEDFKKISYAYDVLSDENKKSRYDSMGHEGLKSGGRSHGGFDEAAREFFASYQRANNLQRYSIKVRLTITIDDVYNGVSSTFNYNRLSKCKPCNGKGGTNPKTCTSCSGSGKKIEIINTPHGHMQHVSDCQVCGGGGTLFDDVCTTCNGAGSETTRETVTLDIPHGFINGDTIIKDKMGHMSPDGVYGDLIIIISVIPNNDYEIINNFDLISMVRVPYEILILGGKIKFLTIDKSVVNISVPPMSKIGDKLRLKGKGLKQKDFEKVRGNQILVLDIDMPTKITEIEKEMLEKIKKSKE